MERAGPCGHVFAGEEQIDERARIHAGASVDPRHVFAWGDIPTSRPSRSSRRGFVVAVARGGEAAGQPRMPNSRRRADWAAQTPHMPWTPPPGGVDDEHR